MKGKRKELKTRKGRGKKKNFDKAKDKNLYQVFIELIYLNFDLRQNIFILESHMIQRTNCIFTTVKLVDTEIPLWIRKLVDTEIPLCLWSRFPQFLLQEVSLSPGADDPSDESTEGQWLCNTMSQHLRHSPHLMPSCIISSPHLIRRRGLSTVQEEVSLKGERLLVHITFVTICYNSFILLGVVILNL